MYYIVDRLRKNNVNNVAFVWHSYASYPIYMHKQLADFYPGDDYVDWFGVSFFEPGNISSANLKAVVNMAKEHKKPFMLAEATPARVGVDGGMRSYYVWYQPLFKFIKKNDVKMLCYINDDWDSEPMFAADHWKDSRIQSNKEIRKKWLEETSNDRYLHCSKDLYALLGYTIAQ
ncbi:MAG: glycosyl hydrolase [Endomicrobiales bacterium]